MAVIAGVFVAPTPTDTEVPDAGTLRKYAGQTALFAFDFGNMDELEPDGSALASATITADTPSGGAALTIGTVDVSSGYRAVAAISGGTAGKNYTLTCTATMAVSGGDTAAIFIAKGTLQVA